MKKLLFAVVMGMMSTSVFANSDGLRCRFENFGKDGIECRVRVEEKEDAPPVATPQGERKAKLIVECTNGFEFEDRCTHELDESRTDVFVGIRRDTTVVLQVEEDDRSLERLRASLILARDGWAVRLHGKCVKRGDLEL